MRRCCCGNESDGYSGVLDLLVAFGASFVRKALVAKRVIVNVWIWVLGASTRIYAMITACLTGLNVSALLGRR
jgi:hypothetical protein